MSLLSSVAPDMTKIVGGWEPPRYAVPLIHSDDSGITKELLPNVFISNNLITEHSCNKIIRMANESGPKPMPVSIQGLQEVTNDNIGSHRITMWNPFLADQLHRFVEKIDFPKTKICDAFTATDWWQGDKNRTEWEYYGISPMFRYMRYDKGGYHAAHYDAGYIYPDDNYRTLISFVLYLTTNNTGSTRIIYDNQKNIPVWDRNHNDWDRPVLNSEILVSSYPVKGSMLFFDHRICHDVQPYDDGENIPRIIIRGDMIFKAK